MLSVKGALWHNWSKSVYCRAATYAEPRTLEELAKIVRNGMQNGKSIRVVGAGHSFTPLVATSDLLVSIRHLTGIAAINHKQHLVTAWAGTDLKTLGEQLAKLGYAMQNLGDINAQTIAGAISTGTHGTGANFGNIPTQVAGLTILQADGSLLEVNETENKAFLRAARISLGMFGIIVKVTLKVLPAYPLIAQSYRLSLMDCLQQLDQLKKTHRNFEFYWFPYTQTVQVKTMDLYDKQSLEKQKRNMNMLKKVVIENGLFWAMSEVSRMVPRSARMVSTLSAIGVPVGAEINDSHVLYATPRLVKFHEMEYSVPEDMLPEILREMDRTIQRKRFSVHFPIECRYVREDDIWLSPSYHRKSAYIAVHMYKGMDFADYFHAMEAIFSYYDGRPHWGKMHTMTYEGLEAVYPKLSEFLTLRSQLDEHQVFSNAYLKDLFCF